MITAEPFTPISRGWYRAADGASAVAKLAAKGTAKLAADGASAVAKLAEECASATAKRNDTKRGRALAARPLGF